MPVTPEQFADLKAKFAKFVADKETADDATAKSNAADTTLAQAAANAGDARQVETDADAVVAADVADITAAFEAVK